MENRRVKYPCDPCDVITATAEPPERERGEKIVVGVNPAERQRERGFITFVYIEASRKDDV